VVIWDFSNLRPKVQGDCTPPSLTLRYRSPLSLNWSPGSQLSSHNRRGFLKKNEKKIVPIRIFVNDKIHEISIKKSKLFASYLILAWLRLFKKYLRLIRLLLKFVALAKESQNFTKIVSERINPTVWIRRQSRSYFFCSTMFLLVRSRFLDVLGNIYSLIVVVVLKHFQNFYLIFIKFFIYYRYFDYFGLFS
jgi:hypothetical protein